MVRTKVYLKDINYHTLVRMAMPSIEKWISEKDNHILDIFSKLIINKGKPTRFSDLLVSLLPKKDDLAAALLLHFDDVMVEYLNNLLDKNSIVAHITLIKTDTVERNSEALLRIVIDIDQIDYEETMDNLMPRLIQYLTERKDESGRIGHVLKSRIELPGKVIKAAIGAIPLEDRDNLLVDILMEYKLELRDLMNTTIEENNIKAKLYAMKFENM